MKLKQKNKRLSKFAIVSIILLVLTAGVIAYLLLANNSPTKTATTTKYYNPSTSTPTVDVPKSDNTQGQSTNAIPATKGRSTSTATPPASSVIPTTPYGQFVSNRTPKLSDSAQDAENSICSTTPGVTCQITFTLGSTVISLPAQTTDSNGNTSWAWSLKNKGITAGTWKVTITAVNGNNSAFAVDSLAVSQ
jgi:cytoskeletal protein RodZ